MVYKRQEAFRYSFNNPIESMFKITAVSNEPVNTEFGMAEIIDMSPSGLKLKSIYKLPTIIKDIEVEIHFTILEELLIVPGKILWQKPGGPNQYLYGIKLDASEQLQSRIVDKLKEHARISLTQ